jgi:two-component system, cell cycle sensor histidine kinase and response regulator CckA
MIKNENPTPFHEYLVDGKYSLKDLVDIELLRRIFDEFSKATGFTTGLISNPDQEILIATGWRDICTKFHRVCPASAQHCKESNIDLTSQLKQLKTLNIRPCANGLVDGATPVIIRGVHVASLATGQVFFEKPDIRRFKQQAETFGYDVNSYLAAVNAVPIVSEERFKSALSFLSEIAKMIGELGLRQLESKEATRRLEREISERTLAEAAFQEGEAKFRFLTEKMNDLIWTSDLNFHVTYISPSVEKILGFTLEEWMSKEPVETMTPESFSHALTLLDVELKREKEQGIDPERIAKTELEYFHKNGSTVWMELVVSAIRDNTGRIVGIHGVSRDITDRKKSEEAIRASEERSRLIAENAKVVIWFMDMNLHYTYISPYIKHNLDYTPEEYVIKPLHEVLTPSSLELCMQIFSEELEKEKRDDKDLLRSRTIEVEHIHRDGRIILAEINMTFIRDAAGKAVGILGITQDITERKRAESELYRNKLLLEHAQEIAKIGYWEFDLQENSVWASAAAHRIYGLSEDAWTIEEVQKIPLPEYRQTLNKKMSALVQRGEKYDIEFKIKRLTDGAIVDIHSIAEYNASENKIFGIIQDITERKLAEEALKKSEERYRFLAENAQDVIWAFDINSGFTYMSPSIRQLRGFSVDEAIKQRLDQTLTPESYRKAMELFETEQLLEINGKRHAADWSKTIELEQYRKDGSTVWTEVIVNILHAEKGEIKGIMGITRDITERKQAEETLKKNVEKFAKAFLQNAIPMSISTITEGRFIDVSDAFLEWIGKEKDEVIGNTSIGVGFINMEQRDTVLKELLEKGRVENLELQVKIKGEKVGYGLFNSTKIQIAHEDYLLTMVTDITERKKAEEEKKRLEERLIQAQKMESIGTLAGGIAHDFNNLLTGVLGNVSLALMRMDESNPLRERLKNIEEYVQRGSDLTKQLLGFARGGKYEVKPTNLIEFIRKSSDMFGRTKKEIRIHHKAQEGIWPVEVDRGQMEQVLINLYVNAWQAMTSGGDLYLLVENVTLGVMDVRPYDVRPGRFVRVTVTDTGIGMDEATKARIFEPFFTTKELGRGTGLGLASVYGIIKNHGGFITVESQKGIGSSFMIHLPASNKEIVDIDRPKDKIQTGQETMLLIDDEVMILDIGSKMLEGLGYKVLTAAGGRQGLQIFEDNQARIDLVILDMIMPDISGKETFDFLRRIYSSVKVLLSSGYSLDGQAKEIMQNGCKGFIQKPFTMAELSKKIRRILDERDET